MPRRKIRSRTTSSVTPREIEALRSAIQNDMPWLLHTDHKVFRRTGLSIRLNILLAHVTGITSGVSVFLSGESHPSRETVAAVKAQLQDDIAAAEKRFASFKIERWSGADLRRTNPFSPGRTEY